MLPRVKWGLITGGAVAILNLCGGVLMGAVNNCLAIVTVAGATIVAGYFAPVKNPPRKQSKLVELLSWTK